MTKKQRAQKLQKALSLAETVYALGEECEAPEDDLDLLWATAMVLYRLKEDALEDAGLTTPERLELRRKNKETRDSLERAGMGHLADTLLEPICGSDAIVTAHVNRMAAKRAAGVI